MSIKKKTKKCDECGSGYNAESSMMASLCPECAYQLYGYENCQHEFDKGYCRHCDWDGSVSQFVKSKAKKE